MGDPTTQLLVPITMGKRPLPFDFEPGPFDVICGRSRKEAFGSVGNRRLRLLISMNLKHYKKADSRSAKSLLLTYIVDTIRMNGGGFIIKRQSDSVRSRTETPISEASLIESSHRTSDSNDRWFDIGDRFAKDKVGHMFRDVLASSKNNQAVVPVTPDGRPINTAILMSLTEDEILRLTPAKRTGALRKKFDPSLMQQNGRHPSVPFKTGVAPPESGAIIPVLATSSGDGMLMEGSGGDCTVSRAILDNPFQSGRLCLAPVATRAHRTVSSESASGTTTTTTAATTSSSIVTSNIGNDEQHNGSSHIVVEENKDTGLVVKELVRMEIFSMPFFPVPPPVLLPHASTSDCPTDLDTILTWPDFHDSAMSLPTTDGCSFAPTSEPLRFDQDVVPDIGGRF